MQGLILILVMATTATLVMLIYRLATGKQRAMEERLASYTIKLQTTGQKPKEMLSRKGVGLKDIFQSASKVFAAKSYTKKMELELDKADIPLKGEEFILINLLAVVVPAGLVLLLFRNLPLGIILASAGLVLPKVFVQRAKKKRAARFNSQIGDALVVMSNSLRAGFSFLQAMEMVSKEMQPPIADEFARSLREMNLGTPTEEAMLNLVGRIESDDLDLVVTAVLIQRQVGGNLSEVLDNISHTIRERVRIKGEIKTLTAQGRISGMIIGLLPVVVALFLSVINPSYMNKLFTTATGMAALTGGVISQGIGIVLIKKIVDIDV